MEDRQNPKSACAFIFLLVRTLEEKKEKHGCHSNCHYVGGNYEKDENGERERTGAKTFQAQLQKNKKIFKKETVEILKIKFLLDFLK